MLIWKLFSVSCVGIKGQVVVTWRILVFFTHTHTPFHQVVWWISILHSVGSLCASRPCREQKKNYLSDRGWDNDWDQVGPEPAELSRNFVRSAVYYCLLTTWWGNLSSSCWSSAGSSFLPRSTQSQTPERDGTGKAAELKFLCTRLHWGVLTEQKESRNIYNTWKFSLIRAGVTDLGMTTTFLSMWNLMRTCVENSACSQ